MPKVSIIMGVFRENKEYLYRSIMSIVKQTFEDWEFIICDDGSGDDTFEYLSQIINGDSRFVLIQNLTNIGLAPTLNICFKLSKGEYIARMDSDDVSSKDRLKKQVEILEKFNEIDFIGTGVNLIDGNGVWGKRIPKEFPSKEDFLWGSQFIHPSTMMRRQMLIECEGYRVSNETIRTEDYDLFMRAYANGLKGYNIQECLVDYTEDQKSFNKRKFKYRINEMRVRYRGFGVLGLYPLGYMFVIKPILIGLIPINLMRYLKLKFATK